MGPDKIYAKHVLDGETMFSIFWSLSFFIMMHIRADKLHIRADKLHPGPSPGLSPGLSPSPGPSPGL